MPKSIWITPLTLADLNNQAKDTFSDLLNIQFTEIGDRHLIAQMPVHSNVLQPFGAVHGGATAALAETVASAAANCCVDTAHKMCVGLELNINHLRAMHNGHLDAIAQPLHLGKTTQVWEIKIYDAAKNLISAARLTAVVLDKKNSASRRILESGES